MTCRQPRTFGTLVPSFQRVFTHKRSVGTAQIIECDLMGAFRKHYATLQQRTPDMPPPGVITEGFKLRCLSVMQHCGVPTRLLDRTSSCWTAVYFDCAGDPNTDAELWFYDHRPFRAQTMAQPELAALPGSAPRYPMLPPIEPTAARRCGWLGAT